MSDGRLAECLLRAATDRLAALARTNRREVVWIVNDKGRYRQHREMPSARNLSDGV